jgi:hypothetical protein
MIIEEGTQLDFKRAVLNELPSIPHVGEMWKLRFQVNYRHVQITHVTEMNVVFKIARQNSLMTMAIDKFLRWQETGRAKEVALRAVSGWELP